jgi:surface protein
MNSYNNRLPQGGYKSSKGTGVFSNPTGVTAGNIRPLTNNDPSNSVPQKFGLPRPIKHYRKGISVTSLDNSTNSRQVKSSTGGGSLIGQMIDIPGGFSIKENSSNEISNTEELDKDCKTCQGVGIISDWQPITDLTEKPEPETQTPQYCCNEERNALRRSRSSNTKLKKNYYTSTTNYLYNRCQTFEQKQFNYLSTGNAETKPGAPLSQDNIYKANCNPNLEIQFTESQLPDGITLTPSNPLGCETVQYKPNNYKYGQQGAVSSSDRLLRLNVETIDTNRANIIKSQENLTKSKYFPNASGSENNSCCIIGSNAVSSFGTTILYITYPLVTRTFRTLTHRFSFPSSFSSTSDPPVPVIQNEYILVVPSYELIGSNQVKMTLKYQLFTNNDAELLTVGLSFANNVDYYNQNTSIIEIIQFDGMPLYGLGNQFSGLTPEILISAPDQPRIINGTSALNCFKDCTNFNSPGILNWNIANVVNLQGIFANAILFNQPVGSWDTSNVTNMSYMFYGASAFNQYISTLDTSAVEDMSHMFENATIFNNGEPGIQTISGTAASSNYIDSTRTLSCPNGLFLTDLSLNDGIVISTTAGVVYSSQIQPPIVSDVSLVLLTAYGGNLIAGTITSIQKIPTSVGGNVPLSSWNTGNVQDMKKMFQYALSFNQYIGDWDTQSVTEMSSMFVFASSFNNGQISGSSTESLNAWNTGSVTLMNNMFQNASAFNQPIGDWDTHSVTDMQFMFKITQFNQPLITNGDKWNTGSVENMRYMFQQTSAFNQDISSWDTSSVTNMSYMFYKALAFNNGETGTVDISGNPFTSAFYTNSTRLLTSPNSKFRTQLSPSDVLIITAGTPTTPIIYTSQIQTSPIVSDVSLVLLTAYGSNIAAGTITSIKKQVVGTKDMSWNTSILIPDLQYMFSDATYFNQNVSSFTVGNATNMFSSSSTSLRGIFNNGQLAGSNNNSLSCW